MARTSPRPYRKRTEIEIEQGRWMRDILADRLASGYSVADIAHEFGASRRSVQGWLREYGCCPCCGHPLSGSRSRTLVAKNGGRNSGHRPHG